MTERVETLSAGQLAQGLGVPRNTILSWLHRGYGLPSSRDGGIQGGGSAGRHRRFTFRATMQIAVANAILKVGFGDAQLAFDAAARFAFGSAGMGPTPQRRVPGFPYPSAIGHTFVVVGGGKSGVFLDDGTPHFLRNARAALGADGVVALEALPVFNHVCQMFGAAPGEELTAAYAVPSPTGGFIASDVAGD